MRATLDIPDDLMKTVQKLSGERSKTKAITVAMQEYIRQKKVRDLLALKGRISLSFDWKGVEEKELRAERSREKLLEKRRA